MIKKRSLLSILNNHVIDYPTPVNINYFWSLGALAFLCLVVQLITGIFLAMHYTPHIDYAFTSVEHIMRDVNNGWLFRYLHANGASMFFVVVYAHICRGLYYSSYTAPRHILWCTGVIIFLLMMATGFIGYVLPWGQMSFWGATVITNLFSAIPVFGGIIVELLWGGFSVDNATLNRFLSLHYLLPFIITGLSLVHLALVHAAGNGNPLGAESKTYNVTFAPYSLHIKYVFVSLVLLTIFMFIVCFFPNTLGHSDNYIQANPMVTPAHIVPEWYFLPFYAILRSIPDKLGGVIAMVGAILLLLLLPFITPTLHTRSSAFRPITRKLFWFQVGNCMVLGWIGGNIVETPFIEIGQIATVFYFLYFLVLLPGGAWLEVYLMKNLKH